ncbi:CoA pyrophosphatase [Hymenobacter sp. BT175]|uniref:NUDIX hydrolase n=1 Tax=Hymenobacter translucens TaxID=2886507 RepID=UPI001D0DCB23|nr:CoA pyrophosphatase [Hymenobacter translucens]MCC2546964.1 CoA pyrophosphatase [Hymenobacter translucens]
MTSGSSSSEPTIPLREASVLVPVYRNAAGELILVLIRRTMHGAHGGELAFPGGKRDPNDSSARATALREAEEEISLPATAVELLAELPVVQTRATGFRISPFLGRITRPEKWQWQAREIEEVLEVSLAELLLPGRHAAESVLLPGQSRPLLVAFYRIGEYYLWGVSYRIVRELLPRLQAGEWEV